MARQDEMQIPLPLATGVAECAPDLSLSHAHNLRNKGRPLPGCARHRGRKRRHHLRAAEARAVTPSRSRPAPRATPTTPVGRIENGGEQRQDTRPRPDRPPTAVHAFHPSLRRPLT